ncbi:MAG: GGDEF domain-containing protein [Sulfurimonas sp.]|nr:GGDEF domain-containing protein [Sulfurimonas sp.]MBU3938060.1 GGDEF domain-containing protein [bacterium]
MKYKIDDKILSVINVIPNPVIVVSNDELQSVNSAFLEFFGFQSLEEFKKTHACIDKLFAKDNGYFSPSDIVGNEYWTDYLFSHPEVSRIVSMIKDDNEVINFELILKKIENYSDYIIVFNDITTHIAEKKEYQYFAYHDHLTKIYNRQKFDELFLRAFEDKKRYKDNLSILLIDIDHFKMVNDNYGHIIGDLTLVALAGLISKSLRINDIFARWGGEEFIILLPRTDIEAAYTKAQEIRAIIEAHVDKELPLITVSIGVTEMNKADTIKGCLQRVDKALYLAKEKRNDVVKII